MLTKDIISKPLTTEWAVVGRTTSIGKYDKSDIANRVKRYQTDKVRLVSTATYEETRWISQDPKDVRFTTTTTDRTKRLMVTNGIEFWVIPAGDFLGVYADLEPAWAQAEAIHAQREAQRAQRDSIREQAVAQATVSAENIKQSILDSIKQVLGYQGLSTLVDIRVKGDWADNETRYETEVGGNVTMTYQQFQRLIEKVAELQDA